jgi:peptide/nickel transport system substrate-binding protein
MLMLKKTIFFCFACLSFSLLWMSCGPTAESPSDKVRVHVLGDVQHLNPLTATDAQSTIMGFQTHQYLYYINPKTYEYESVLAKERARVYEEDSIVKLDFEIRPEAKWDNGEAITGEDLVFSMKLNFVPDAETGHLRPYLDYVADIIVDSTNNKKFTVICKRPYMSAESSIAANQVFMPAYVYDPEGVLKNYSLKDLLSDDEEVKKKLAADEKLKQFAKFFNGQQFKRETNVGSGPYSFVKWDTNQKLVLKRKDNWWGDAVKDEDANPWLRAYANDINYVTITDLNTAVVALKGKSLDAMHSVPPKQFVEDLSKSEDFKSEYFLDNPPLFAYDYIGMNMKDPRLGDVNVRKAIAHLMDVDELVKTELYGLGHRVTTFVHPLFKERLNADLVPYDFNLEKAKTLLAEAGWKDLDEDGILDKEIEGEMQSLKLRIDYNNGNSRRETTCILLKDAARKAGIEIEILPLEWATYLDKHNKHDFDMYVAGWVASPTESDPKQIWHTESYDGGSNYVGYGTPKTDVMIDKLRVTVDDAERFQIYKDLQADIHETVPYVFLIARKNTVCVSKKYETSNATGLRSGVFANGMKGISVVDPG